MTSSYTEFYRIGLLLIVVAVALETVTEPKSLELVQTGVWIAIVGVSGRHVVSAAHTAFGVVRRWQTDERGVGP